MTDYSNWKVPELKAELKRKGIPQTGLRLKQQIIDRLLEAEQSDQAAPADEPDQPAVKTSDAEAEQQQEAAESEQQVEESAPKEPAPVNGDEVPSATAGSAQEVPSQDATVERAPEPPTPAEEPVEAAPAPSDKTHEEPPAPEPAQQQREPEVHDAPAPMESEPAPVPVEPTPSSEGSVDDTKKRKRRSQSPPPSPRTAAQKKAKTQEGEPKVILSDDVVEKGKQPPDVEVSMAERENESRPEGVEAETAARERSPAREERKGDTQAEKADETHATKRTVSDARFKDLFSATNGDQSRPEQPSQTEPEPRAVEPALHPATTSLYIRNFMRPLQPAALKTHLASLATPPGESSESDMIINFFLDSIKTHCFVTFANISAAARVRSAVHDTIWPDERTRKPLWVDFVPEDKVKEWIETEQNSSGSGRGAPRWEVTYEDSEDGVRAVLQEAAANQMPQGRGSGQDLGLNAPTGPRASRDLPPPPGPSRPDIPDRGFKALDDRFKSTIAKPKLYFLPVPRDISDKRLDKFDDLARAGPVDRRGGDEMRKYTFEDTDFFADRGPEYGRRGPRGGRGGGRGGFAGDFGGGWGGGNWRGRR